MNQGTVSRYVSDMNWPPSTKTFVKESMCKMFLSKFYRKLLYQDSKYSNKPTFVLYLAIDYSFGIAA